MADYSKMKLSAQKMRLDVLRMNHAAGSGHTGGSFSCAEILTVLYDEFLSLNPDQPNWEGRDRFLLSKGHAAPMLYATLARKGFIDPAILETLRKKDSPLQGHPCKTKLPCVEMPSGPLGLCLSVGVGMALAFKQTKSDSKVFVLCGDGELNEGQNWEALMSASKWHLDNFIMIVDRNHVQLDGTEAQIMPMGDLKAKLEAFGMTTFSCKGHDVEDLYKSFEKAVQNKGPSAVIAETIKGKGVSFMEGQSAWHGKPIDKNDYAKAKAELEAEMK